MNTKLITFPNTENQSLRGIITFPSRQIKKGVICLHGFERCSTTEKKFKSLADEFSKNNIATLRFDFSGTGISDGNFKYTTIEKQSLEFLNAFKTFQNKIDNKKISVVAHSLGACVLANQIKKINESLGKIVLISPALNQKELLRYWFVTNIIKKTDPNIKIDWNNYKTYLVEEDFLNDCRENNKVAKMNYINPEYFLNAKNLDYSMLFDDINSKILHIHGNKDLAVPIESLNIKFLNKIVVNDGDHDLEKPNQISQWLYKTVNFISK